MSSNFQQAIYIYIYGFLTQWAFHRVQEHPKRSSLLSSILILIFLPFTCSLFIYVFTIHLRIYYSYSLFTIYYLLFTIHIRIYLCIYYSYTYSFTYLLFIHVKIRRYPLISVLTRCVE